jgi:hypothetical protein
MHREMLNKSLAKAADAAGYAMAASDEDLAELNRCQTELLFRNGHAAAASAARRMSLPFARFEQWVAHMLSLSDIRANGSRGLLPSR